MDQLELLAFIIAPVLWLIILPIIVPIVIVRAKKRVASRIQAKVEKYSNNPRTQSIANQFAQDFVYTYNRFLRPYRTHPNRHTRTAESSLNIFLSVSDTRVEASDISSADDPAKRRRIYLDCISEHLAPIPFNEDVECFAKAIYNRSEKIIKESIDADTCKLDLTIEKKSNRTICYWFHVTYTNPNYQAPSTWI